MTDEDVLLRLQQKVGGSLTYTGKRKEHYKETWRWLLCGDEAANLLIEILPYMGKRRSEKINFIISAWQKKQVVKENFALARLAYKNKEGSSREIASRFGISHQSVIK